MINNNNPYVNSSFEDKSAGIVLWNSIDVPNNAFIHVRSTNVGASKYNNTTRNKYNAGNKSNKKVKNKISEINIIDPGKPKKTNKLTRLIKNNFGHKKLIPLISVIRRVLKRRAIASTSRNEFVESNAWLINIQKPDNISEDWPLTIQMVNQCISTTVEYATNFFKSIW